MSIHRVFFRYVVPSMLAFALSGVYAIADGCFVGNALGDHALAAVNIAYPITAFLQAVGTGIGMSGAIQYSICSGAGDKERGRRFFGMASFLLVVAGVILTVLVLLASPGLLQLFGASGELHALAQEYIRYIAFGAIFQVLGTGLVPFIRNMGGSVAAMTAMIAGFITNIGLDYLFVWVLPWGMMGAAVATAAGQAVTLLICLLFFACRRTFPLFCFRGEGRSLLKRILQVSLSPFGLTFSPNITLILVNMSAALHGGSAAVTAYAPISYISAVVMLLLQGVSDGSQPLLSLSYGEGNRARIEGFRGLAYRFACAVGFLCMAGSFFLRGELPLLFGASRNTAQAVAQLLPIFICGYLFVCVSRVTTAYFYATSQNVYAYALIYGEPVFLALLLLFLPGIAGVWGTWLSVPLSQLLAAGVSVLLLMREKRAVSPAPRENG